MGWVVRGGLATARSLVDGYEEHGAVPGLFGFSVQFAPNIEVDELARAGKIRNGQISYATDDALRGAVQPLGYDVRLVKSSGHGFHHTFVVVYDATGSPLHALPNDIAEAISRTFQRRPNPYRIR